MNNNIDIRIIKKNMLEVSKLFDPSNETYQIINATASNPQSTTEDLLITFKKIGDLKEYPKELANYFYKTYNDLQALDELNKEIESLMNDINKENELLMEEFKKRNVEYQENFQFETDYDKMTYNEKKEYIEKLKEDLNTLKEKNKKIEESEKELGEKFDEKTLEEVNSPDLKESFHNEKMQQINEDAENNYKVYVNPTLDDVTTFYNYMQDNQTEESKLNVEIDFDSKGLGEVNVKIGYKGTEVNEAYPMLLLNYTDVDQFQKEVLPFLIERHMVDSDEIKKRNEGTELNSENSFGETIQFKGNSEYISEISNDMDEQIQMYVDAPEQQNKNKPKVRVRDLENSAYASYGLYIILGVSIITIIVLIVYLLIRN